jgi:hypothetical protein
MHRSYTLGSAIQFETIQIAATLAVHTNLVFNNMLFQGSSLTWQDCRYELLPYLHIPWRRSAAYPPLRIIPDPSIFCRYIPTRLQNVGSLSQRYGQALCKV